MNKDFVLIELLLDNSSLSIYVDAVWVRKYMNVNGKDAEDTTTI